MTNEQRHYAWDRLLRAAVRLNLMSSAQRKDLAESIENLGSDIALHRACGALVLGELTVEEAKAGYQAAKQADFDLAAYRASLAPPPDPSRVLDAALKAALG